MCNLQQRKIYIIMQLALIVLDLKQPATPLKTDNHMTELFLKLGMKPKRSKTWGMKWYWLRDKEVFDQLILY